MVVSNDDGSVVQNQVVQKNAGKMPGGTSRAKPPPGQTVSVYHSQEYEPRQAAHELEVSAEPMVDPDSPDFVDREAPEVTDEQYREMERNAALASQPPVPYVTSLEVEQAKPEATPVQQAVALLEAPKDAPKAIREFTRMPMPPQENIKPPPPPESVVFEPAVATVAKQALVEKMPDIRARLLDYGRRTTEDRGRRTRGRDNRGRAAVGQSDAVAVRDHITDLPADARASARSSGRAGCGSAHGVRYQTKRRRESQALSRGNPKSKRNKRRLMPKGLTSWRVKRPRPTARKTWTSLARIVELMGEREQAVSRSAAVETPGTRSEGVAGQGRWQGEAVGRQHPKGAWNHAVSRSRADARFC